MNECNPDSVSPDDCRECKPCYPEVGFSSTRSYSVRTGYICADQRVFTASATSMISQEDADFKAATEARRLAGEAIGDVPFGPIGEPLL